MKKRIVLAIAIIAMAFVLVSCKDETTAVTTLTTTEAFTVTTTTTESDLSIRLHQIYDLGVASGDLPGTYEEWLESIQGEQGIPGEDGRDINLQVASGYVQWQYVGDTTWTNLIALSSLIGADGADGIDGTDGEEVMFQVFDGYIQWKYESDVSWTDLISLAIITGADGTNGREVTFRVSDGYIQWQYVGDASWLNLIEVSSLVGSAGETGVGISSMAINDQGELIVTYTDGTEKNLGQILVTYLVEFKNFDGSVLDIQHLTYGSAAVAPADPVRAGYVFTGWDHSFSSITGNTVVTATYSPETFTVAFDTMGGAMENAIAGVPYGTTIILPYPVKEGYSFLGWYTGTGVSNSQFFENTLVTEDLILYAKWQTATSVTVYDYESLTAALDNFSYDEIYLGADIYAMSSVYIDRQVSIYGNGYTLYSYAGSNGFISIGSHYDSERDYYNKYAIIEGSSIQINDLYLEVAPGLDNDTSYDTAIYIGYTYPFNLVLNRVNSSKGMFSFLYMECPEGLNLEMNNCDIAALYGMYFYGDENSNIVINNTTITAMNAIALEYTYYGYFTINNSYLYGGMIYNDNFDLDEGTFSMTECRENQIQIDNSVLSGKAIGDYYNPLILSESESSSSNLYMTECTYNLPVANIDGMIYSSDGLLSTSFERTTVVIPEGTTSIEANAFYGAEEINRVILPDSVISIGEYAFAECYGLEQINIPDGLISIGEDAFYNAYDLNYVIIPASVETIGFEAFYDNSYLTVYAEASTIPAGWDAGWINGGYPVEWDIAGYTTENGLTYVVLSNNEAILLGSDTYTVTSITIPEAITISGTAYPVTSIYSYAFYEQYDLSYVYFASNSNIVTIKEGAFFACGNLKMISIPVSVVIIEPYAFEQCYKLAQLIFEDGSVLQEIGDEAFSATNLHSVTIPASVTYIGYMAFGDCYSLTHVYFAPSSNLNQIGESAFSNNNLYEITIPDSVTIIEGHAFYGNYRLASVNFGENSQLQSIGSNAFQSCALTTITIPSNVLTVGDFAFGWDTYLTEVIFAPGSQLQDIGQYAFSFTALTSITIPASVTHIYNYAFLNCSDLVNIVFEEGSSLIYIGTYTFNACSALESVEIPATVATLGDYAFQDCTSLTSVSFQFAGEGDLTSIGNYVFKGCTSLADFYIPDTITSIGNNAFYNCGSMTSILIKNNVTAMGRDVFVGCTGLTINVEASSKPAGWDASWNSSGLPVVWGCFNTTIAFESNGGTAVDSIWQEQGTAVTEPVAPTMDGYVFDGWYEDVALTIPYTFSTMPYEDITLYAAWTLAE
ncbi:MAG TPA: leucine-rich repeat protein [Bacillota bacterium]|nr:leucine-rich repeat protein [Bacillota bacterium]HPF42615.1 leucine-rich repeat protein [Bacillota bacterium]HPJ86240.1 leucine-rich repeat protein [Bacillota bacterium]HPQ62270.1 leucine-rich repeat protein [Bacillota bacterium]HRX92197.1 leucine-rich repeat protein [Candidatus Izemoplasmatales bacterium]